MNPIALMTLGLAPMPLRSCAGRTINRDDVDAPQAPAPSAAATKPPQKAEKPIKRAGQKTQRLIRIITHDGPITTVDLAAREGMTTKMVWGLLRYHLIAGTVRRIGDSWHAGIADPATAAAVRHLVSRGWTCIAPENETKAAAGDGGVTHDRP